jgi:hypothetical protein
MARCTKYRRLISFPEKISVKDVKVDNNFNLWIATENEGLYIYYPATRTWST